MSALQHPTDDNVIDMAEEIVQRRVLDKTLCKCPNLDEPLDCVDLPEFSYFGTVCEPIFWVSEEHNAHLAYPEVRMLSSTHGVCFALPGENILPTVDLLRFRDVYIDPLSGVIFDRNKNAVFDQFLMKSLWLDTQTEVKGIVKVKKVISFVQVSFHKNKNKFKGLGRKLLPLYE
jgi:hypothetical protein